MFVMTLVVLVLPYKGGLLIILLISFPWQLCAYQCIFQNYYRLDDKSIY